MAVGDAFKAAIVKAGLDAATASAERLRVTLEGAAAAADKIKAPQGLAAGASAEVDRLTAAYLALAGAEDKAAQGALTVRRRGRASGGNVAPKMPASGPADRVVDQAGKAPGEAADSAFRAPKDLKYLLKHAGIGKAAMGAMGSAAALELSKLALGYQGMAMLGAITQRTSLQIRQLFSGVNPAPVVRAFDTLTNQIFNKAGPAGKALGSIFDHVFNGLFGAVEKAEPTIQAFFEYAIVGALKLETAYYELRLAALPLSDTFGDLAAAIAPLGSSFGGAREEIEFTARDMQAFVEVIDKATKGWTGFINAIQGKGAWLINAKQNLGMISAEEAVRQRRAAGVQTENDRAQEAAARHYGQRFIGEGDKEFAERQRREAPPSTPEAPGGAAAAASAGAATGKAYTDGLAKGVAAGAPGAAAAGGAAAQGVDTAARDALKIRSPSKVGEDTGEEYPAGVARGVRRAATEAQDEMARAATPRKVDRAEAAGAPSGAASSFPAEALSLLRQIEANTRPRAGGGASGAAWGGPIHTIASVLGVSPALGAG